MSGVGDERTSLGRWPKSEIDPEIGLMSVAESFGTSDRLDLGRKLLTLERSGLNEPTLASSANVTPG
jgi:hypothetical protein